MAAPPENKPARIKEFILKAKENPGWVKVRIRKHIISIYGSHFPGVIITIPKRVAINWVAGGIAVGVNDKGVVIEITPDEPEVDIEAKREESEEAELESLDTSPEQSPAEKPVETPVEEPSPTPAAVTDGEQFAQKAYDIVQAQRSKPEPKPETKPAPKARKARKPRVKK